MFAQLVRTARFSLAPLLLAPLVLTGSTFYIDVKNGSDDQDGLSQQEPWKTLAAAQKIELRPGDRLLLRRGMEHRGSLIVSADGTIDAPVIIDGYGEGPPPVINAAGYRAGIEIRSARNLTVRGLEIVADGGMQRDGQDPRFRYGVLVGLEEGEQVSHLSLENLHIHHVFPDMPTPKDGRNPTTYVGTAISVLGREANEVTDLLIQNCRIERTGFKAIELKHVRRASILGNTMKEIGGPAIQPSIVEDLLVSGNVVEGSGSSVDVRMHGRGSGIWPWTSRRVLIERNRFMHARGKADSCGIHIDFNCSEVTVQYNFSYDNEGGFIEILGNCTNSIYRYNISVNDGARVKGREGAHQEGKVIWTSGYVGRGRERVGPFDSYLYNNTVYVGENTRSCFSIAHTTDGLLIANNIFHIMGKTENVLGDQDRRENTFARQIPRVDVGNNLYLHRSVLPPGLPFVDRTGIYGDPEFANPGGAEPADYVPRNAALIRDRGLVVHPLLGSASLLPEKLTVTEDFMGQSIVGSPDIGAIELPLVSSTDPNSLD